MSDQPVLRFRKGRKHAHLVQGIVLIFTNLLREDGIFGGVDHFRCREIEA